MIGRTHNGRSAVDPDLLYSLPFLQQVTGLGATAFRVARKNGLRILYLHKRTFVLGADFIRYAIAAGSTTPPGQEAENAG